MLALDRNEMGFAAYAQRVWGAIAARKGQIGVAEAHYATSLSLAIERGMLPLAAQCHVGLASVRTTAGRGPEAAANEAAAHELCQQMKIDVSDLRLVEHARSR
jgi:hypothetical protein